jgi:hypothetical protein
MKLESYHSAEDKGLYKVVRCDSYTDVPGDIITADEATGECCMGVRVQDKIETKSYSFGHCGIRIIRRGR